MARPDHDALYHRFFSDPLVVAQLVRDFVTGPWLADLDLDRMERLNAKFHADTGERRDGDMIWRLSREDGGDTYLLLLLEFQSTVDTWMALRVLVYVGLLWQFLVKERRVPPGGKLPPVLPVVIYNGDTQWQAPQHLTNLIGLPEGSPLWRWQPASCYHLIDEGVFGADELKRREGLPALLFRLETWSDLAEGMAVANEIVARLAGDPGFSEVRAVFAELMDAILAPRDRETRTSKDLLEARKMLETRVERWKQRYMQEYQQHYREEVLLEGRQEGIQEGRQVGRREGEASILLRQLERRFGAQPTWARERVSTADVASLEEWGLRVLDAATLEQIFV